MIKNVNIKKIIAVSSLPFVLLNFVSCSNTVVCKITDRHAHKYYSDSGYIRYIEKEVEKHKGYIRDDDYILITPNESELLKFENNNNLIRINYNFNTIKEKQQLYKSLDHIEYEFKRTNIVLRRVGKVLVPITNTTYEWTINPNHSDLTSKTRYCHFLFSAVKVIETEKGKFKLEYSPLSDDVLKISDEYPYIDSKFCYVVDSNTEDFIYDSERDIGKLLQYKKQYPESFISFEDSKKLVLVP